MMVATQLCAEGSGNRMQRPKIEELKFQERFKQANIFKGQTFIKVMGGETFVKEPKIVRVKLHCSFYGNLEVCTYI